MNHVHGLNSLNFGNSRRAEGLEREGIIRGVVKEIFKPLQIFRPRDAYDATVVTKLSIHV